MSEEKEERSTLPYACTARDILAGFYPDHAMHSVWSATRAAEKGEAFTSIRCSCGADLELSVPKAKEAIGWNLTEVDDRLDKLLKFSPMPTIERVLG